MIQAAIHELVEGKDLNYAVAKQVMDEIMSGKTTPIQTSAYLTALRLKKETIDEITASAAAMRDHCIRLLHDEDVIEIVGTGGDGAHTFNISTAAALLVAASGVPVAKHGNRSASSKCGAADVLEALGVNIHVSAEKSSQMLKDINICFLFAQNYHISMRYVAPIRRELGFRTIFNILGPLTNPAGAKKQLLGVYDESLLEPLTQVLHNLGVRDAMVVHGEDGLDEISLCAPTKVYEIKDGKISSYTITPEQFGLQRCKPADLTGGDPQMNAEIMLEVLSHTSSPKQDAAILNAAAALYIYGNVTSIDEGIKQLRTLIQSGLPHQKLQAFIKYTNEE